MSAVFDADEAEFRERMRECAEEARAQRGNGAAAEEAPWPEPNTAILYRSAASAPALPLDVFGPFWSRWIGSAAEGANAPPDYTALPLLANTSALIGNARWVVAWRSWAEPPALWLCSVGDPSSGKTSGATPVTRDVLRQVEAHMARDYPAALERWQEAESVARVAHKAWEKAVARAVEDGKEPPPKPDAARTPPRPVLPRVRVCDATMETIAPLLQSQPKGALHARDELAGWLLNLSRYSNGGTDRPFWLESYNGGPYQVDRQKYPVPIFVPHLTVSTFGTIQPERLAEILSGADDGLSSRFLWAWPEVTRDFDMPNDAADPHQAAQALIRLADLVMSKNDGGEAIPAYVHLASDARRVLVDLAREAKARERKACGLLKSAYGKVRGQALRLALVLEYLWWCVDGGPEPTRISCAAMEAAAALMDAYFIPMAIRVLGDASVPADERNARTLAAWIMET
jgi:hypothetical protein